MGVVFFDELCALLPSRQVDPVQLHRHPGLTGIFDSNRTINAAPWGSAAGQGLAEPCAQVGMRAREEQSAEHSSQATMTVATDTCEG
jgi:hypothetical protein